MAMRVILADDHQLVHAGLRALLQSFPDVEVLAECSDGQQALECVARLRPEVLLLDAQGRPYLSPAISRTVLQGFLHPGVSPTEPPGPELGRLTLTGCACCREPGNKPPSGGFQ